MKRLVAAFWLAGCRFDRDGDGYVGRDDCDDHDAAAFPGAVERCNGHDDDCDGDVDGDAGPSYVDADGDGAGDPERPLLGCDHDLTTAALGNDCDDSRPDRYPGAPEACDGVDQDCDALVDEDPSPPLYVDDDADGFGDPTKPVGCEAFAVADNSDCNDLDDQIYPGAPERCNGQDDACDGDIDDEVDLDADGAPSCTDCDDNDPTRSPLRTELCNGIDDDCDLVVDPPDAWWDERWSMRVPLSVDAGEARPDPIVFDLDARAALDLVGVGGGFDPQSARAVLQDCGGEGLIELPMQFLDHAWGLDAVGSGDDLVGDERGAVVVLHDLDGDLRTIELTPSSFNLAVYLGGPAEPAPAWETDLITQDNSFNAANVGAEADPARGGLWRLTVDGLEVASQADAASGNGLRTDAGPLSAQDVPGTVGWLDASNITAALRSSASMNNPGGSLAASWTARRFAGRPEIWLRTSIVAVEETIISGPDDRTAAIRPWQARIDGTLITGPNLAWADVSTFDRGLAWRWLAPPAYVTHVKADGVDSWIAANELTPCCLATEGNVSAQTPVVDGPVLVLWPHGAVDAAAWGERAPLVVMLGVPEPR